jgi:hypothetical protein
MPLAHPHEAHEFFTSDSDVGEDAVTARTSADIWRSV